MTHEEFHKLPRTLLGHMSLDTEHFATYKAETPKGGVRIRVHVRKLKNGEYGKVKRSYIFRGKRFESVDELLKYYNGIK